MNAMAGMRPSQAVAGADSRHSVVLATEADRQDWDAYVAAHPEASGYHEWVWREIFSRVFRHENVYLLARRTDGPREGSVVGVLPMVQMRSPLFGRTLTSLPFVNVGGVLADSAVIASDLLAAAAGLAAARRCRHIELRHVARRFDNLPFRQHKVAMHLRLETGLWDRIDRKARNQVRKAEKSGLTVTRGGVELVDSFYQVFARNMRDLGTPVYSKRLFAEVAAAFQDRVRIIVVRKDSLPVAAGLTFRTRTLMEIPWASSIRDFNIYCPNHLLYWHAIETALAEGAEVFDFGRSTPGEGTFKFKEQWGAQPIELHWEYWLPSGAALPDQSPKNPKFRLMIETWKRLPLWAANLLGPSLVRGIP